MLWWLVACGSVGLTSPEVEEGHARIDLEPRGRVEFGSVSPAAGPAEATVTAVSIGTEPVVVEQAWIEGADSGAFYLGELRLPAHLEPEDELSIPVRFDPDDGGAFNGTLVVQINDGSVMERALMGSGCRDADGDGVC